MHTKSHPILFQIRCEVNIRNNTLPAKIRDATLQKIPYICVVGQKEANSNKVSVRKLTGENLGGIQNKKFIQRIKNEIANKT